MIRLIVNIHYILMTFGFCITCTYGCNDCQKNIGGSPFSLHTPVAFQDVTEDAIYEKIWSQTKYSGTDHKAAYQSRPVNPYSSLQQFKECFRKEMEESVLPILRTIEYGGSNLGTGFFIDQGFVTNAHVLENYHNPGKDSFFVIKNPVSPDYADFAMFRFNPIMSFPKLNWLLGQFSDGGIDDGSCNEIRFYVELNAFEETYELHLVQLSQYNRYEAYQIENDGKANYGISGSPIIRAMIPGYWLLADDDKISFTLQHIVYARPKDDHTKVVVFTPYKSISKSYDDLLGLAKQQGSDYCIIYNFSKEPIVDENLDLLIDLNKGIYGTKNRTEDFRSYVIEGAKPSKGGCQRSHIISQSILENFLTSTKANLAQIKKEFENIANDSNIDLYNLGKYTDEINGRSFVIWNPGNLCVGPKDDAYRRIPIALAHEKMLDHSLSPKYRLGQAKCDTQDKSLTEPYPKDLIDYESISRMMDGSPAEQKQADLLVQSIRCIDKSDLDCFLKSWQKLFTNWAEKQQDSGYYKFNWKNVGTDKKPNLYIARQNQRETNRECCRIF